VERRRGPHSLLRWLASIGKPDADHHRGTVCQYALRLLASLSWQRCVPWPPRWRSSLLRPPRAERGLSERQAVVCKDRHPRSAVVIGPSNKRDMYIARTLEDDEEQGNGPVVPVTRRTCNRPPSTISLDAQEQWIVPDPKKTKSSWPWDDGPRWRAAVAVDRNGWGTAARVIVPEP
jgi:hypothetical protein